MRTKSLRIPCKRVDAPQAAVDEAFGRSLRRQTSRSPATGSGSLIPRGRGCAGCRDAASGSSPTSTWSTARTAAASISSRRITRALAISAIGELARRSRTSADRRMIGSSCAWRWISVSMTSGSTSVKKPPPLTGGSCAGSPSTRIGLPNESRSRPSSASTIEHSSITIRPAREAGPSMIELEFRRAVVVLAGAVDQCVDRGRADAALRAHHQRRLAGECGESRLALGALRDMAGERRFADAGIAEQAKHLRFARAQPLADPVEGRPLLARPIHRVLFSCGRARPSGANPAGRR